MKKLFTLSLILVSVAVFAQRSATLYPMENIFQNQFNNPAYEPFSKVSLNLFSGSLDAGFTGFPLGQLIQFDSTKTGSSVSVNDLVNQLGKNNQLIVKNSLTDFASGCKLSDFQFTKRLDYICSERKWRRCVFKSPSRFL